MKNLNYHSIETGWGASCALLLCMAFAILPVTRTGASIGVPGSVPGFSLNFTITEPPDAGPDPNQETPLVFTYTAANGLPAGAVITSGALLMSEPGTVASPTDPNYVNWSDVVIWSGGNTATLYSDEPVGGWPNLNSLAVVVLPEVVLGPPNSGGDGVVYQAVANGTTTWTVVSDVPEPGTGCLLGLGVLVWGLLRKKSA